MSLSDARRIIVDELKLASSSSWETFIANFGGEQNAAGDLPGFLNFLPLTKFQHDRIANPADQGKSLCLDSGRIILVDHLGKGSSGSVYEALLREPTQGDRRVAVKMIQVPESGSKAEERLDQEIQFLCDSSRRTSSRQSDHVVQGIKRFTEGAQVFLVMELQPGITIHDMVSKLTNLGKQLSVRQALLFADGVLNGLNFLHEHDCIHRDIKPKNLIYSSRPGKPYFVCIVDLGIIKDLNQPKTDDNVVMGTAYYMAPECFGNPKHADPRTDLYSLAATLYFMLTGEPPAFAMFLKLDGPQHSQKVAKDRRLWADDSPPWTRKRLDEIRTDVPKSLADLVDRTLDPDPNNRPATIAEFRQKFDPILQLAQQVREIQKRIPGFRSGLHQALYSVVKELDPRIYPTDRNARAFVGTLRRQIRRNQTLLALPSEIRNAAGYNQMLSDACDAMEAIANRIEKHYNDLADQQTSVLFPLFMEELEKFQQLLPELLALQHLFSSTVSGFVGVNVAAVISN